MDRALVGRAREGDETRSRNSPPTGSTACIESRTGSCVIPIWLETPPSKHFSQTK